MQQFAHLTFFPMVVPLRLQDAMRLEEASHALCELRPAQHERRIVIAKISRNCAGPLVR